jgi:hypothetical protein
MQSPNLLRNYATCCVICNFLRNHFLRYHATYCAFTQLVMQSRNMLRNHATCSAITQLVAQSCSFLAIAPFCEISQQLFAQ